MRIFLWVLLFTGFISCKEKQPRIAILKSHDFIIADTTPEPNRFLAFDVHKIEYPIYYIGPTKDTIRIGHRLWRGRTKWKDQLDRPWSRQYEPLRIFVDTSVKTNSQVEFLDKAGNTIEDSSINYHAFLISIMNTLDSTLYLGPTFSLYFIHSEAKNRNGQWVKIDKQLSESSLCLTNEPIISLKPGEMVLSKLRRYRGSFITEFRLAFGRPGNVVVYSNVFRDGIDERTLRE